jgi:hypothetical protein
VKDFDALVCLFRRRYWSRVWVVQEIASASQAVVYCGPDFVEWDMLILASDIFHDSSPILREAFEQHSCEILGHNGPRKVSNRLLRLSGIPRVSMRHIGRVVQVYTHLKATDPRDKIYGLIGLVADPEELGLGLNYEFPVQEVYINFIKTFVSATLELDIICSVRRLENTYNLPSWTPDWRKQRSHRRGFGIITGKGHRWRSAKGSQAICSFYKNSKHIAIMKSRDFSVDKVQIAGNPCDVTYNGVMLKVARAFEEWRSILIDEKGDSLADYYAYFKMIACGYGSFSGDNLDTVMPYFLDGVRNLCPMTPNDEMLQSFSHDTIERRKGAIRFSFPAYVT